MSPSRLDHFYRAFQNLDGAAMQSAYAPDAVFEDEVFSLRGQAEIGAMWTMLCDVTKAKGRDVWRLDYRVAEDGAHAHWEAHYRFSATGRMVHNVIDGEFEFDAAGLISRQRDRFDFWRWSRQALGAPGLLLGWSPMLRSKVRAQAAKNLTAWRRKQAG